MTFKSPGYRNSHLQINPRRVGILTWNRYAQYHLYGFAFGFCFGGLEH